MLKGNYVKCKDEMFGPHERSPQSWKTLSLGFSVCKVGGSISLTEWSFFWDLCFNNLGIVLKQQQQSE